MKIVILNGNADPNNLKYEEYLQQLGNLLTEKGNDISTIKLRDLKINYCTGCFECWSKTPGICTLKDDMVGVLIEYINSDFVLFTSPIVMGFITHLLKGVIDRLLPLSHPYARFVDDRFQITSRYEKKPPISLLLWKDKNYSDDSLEIIDKIFRNDKTRRHHFTKLMDNNFKEIADEINSI